VPIPTEKFWEMRGQPSLCANALSMYDRKRAFSIKGEKNEQYLYEFPKTAVHF
jgi:hypothetical protein